MSITGSVLDHIASIPSYEPGTPIGTVAREHGLDPASLVKLASNENPLGMSPAARAAASAAIDDCGRYPDSACFELRHALASRNGLSASEIVVGAGSVDLIVLSVRAFLDSSRAAIVPQYAFAAYGNAVRAVGARQIVVPARGYAHDLDALAAAVDPSVRVVFLASVNNPTGLCLTPADLERFFDRIPEHVLVVLDEAYREYASSELQADIRRWRRRYSNLLVLRTFSKVYGLAGLRVGYGIGDPQVIETLKRLQTPFAVNSVAQAAALAAISDDDFVERSRDLVMNERARLAAMLGHAGISCLPSEGNFLLVRVSDGARAYRALLRAGVIVRPVANYGLHEWIRVTVGLPDENELFLARLTEHLRS